MPTFAMANPSPHVVWMIRARSICLGVKTCAPQFDASSVMTTEAIS